MYPVDVIAAKRCRGYSAGGYADWFLPSKDELAALYRNLAKAGVGGGFTDGWYLSSTGASKLNFGDGVQLDGIPYRNDDYNNYYLRPVRSF
ncbi:MAG: hypothetical protein NT080_07970 [Spirochaetes bacterium]|nr:hypothetical protein [Spirochaetota bacterium]